MEYEVAKDENAVANDLWRVEAIDYEGEGCGYVAIFSGPCAQERAEHYAYWMNDIQRRLDRADRDVKEAWKLADRGEGPKAGGAA